MQNSVTDIANKHLGSGAVYTQSSEVDSGLLVAVPRSLSRKESNIQHFAQTCIDVWHCYEFSCLHDSGIPFTGTIKFMYSAESEFLVESKSLKLYLHSYALAKMGNTHEDIIQNCEERIKADLQKTVNVTMALAIEVPNPTMGYPINEKDFRTLEFMYATDFADGRDVSSGGYPMRPFINYEEHSIDILRSNVAREWEDNAPSNGDFGHFVSHTFRSNCRVTHQPDWASIYIAYKNKKKSLDPQSLLEYLTSFRNEYHFLEEACELVFDNLWQFFEKQGDLFVGCFYTRRGGIDINPIRYTKSDAYTSNVDFLADEFLYPEVRTDRYFRL